MKKISSALISVFNKENIDEICLLLSSKNIKIYSTGGTYNYIKRLGVDVEKVEDVTSYPSILNGRVKTLHPKIFGGILKTSSKSDKYDSKKYNIPDIDLVIVDLYPFEETVKNSNVHQEIIEKIDIGGISLIRASAKNYEEVVCISSNDQYLELIEVLKGKCTTSLDFRKNLAKKAFEISSNYDLKIAEYISEKKEKSELSKIKELRYGENPHQKGRFIGNLDEIISQIHGKEISFNNLLDIDAALGLLKDIDTKEAVFIIHKHNNPCGVAIRKTLKDAYLDSLSCDNVSAFGGVLTSNQKIDLSTAKEIDKLFFEILIAPDFDKDALKILKTKKNRILIKLKNLPKKEVITRSCLNGVLEQDEDFKTEKISELKVVTNKSLGEDKYKDIDLAIKIAKHTKSNCIVIVKNLQLIGSGTGQVSRIDALNHAIQKSKKFDFNLKDSCLASDAFFPFSDCVEISYNNGINIIVQPGGSIRDQDSIDFCNEKNMSMIFSGIRHFKH